MAKTFEDKLQEIVEHKRTHELPLLLPKADRLRAAALERNDFRSLYDALKKPDRDYQGINLIAEVKRSSPSAGIIDHNFDALSTALEYDSAGASALSILTDEKFFGGKLEYLTQIRKRVQAPCLRKDFIIDAAQIYEASVAGADAILLIAACLDQSELVRLQDVAAGCGLEVLLEVHNEEEMERALNTDAQIIGVNNRNLRTFVVDLETTEELSEEVPEDIVLISESGIRTPEDARTVEKWGCDAILVGEALMRSGNIAESVRDMMGIPELIESEEPDDGRGPWGDMETD